MSKKDRRRPSELTAARGEIESLRARVERLQRENDEMAEALAELPLYLGRAQAGGRPGRGSNFPNHLESVRYLVMAAEYRDHDTGAHLVRIGYLSALLASVCGCDARLTRELLQAAPMHDVGKIGIPDRVLKKPGQLDAAERRLMERHTDYGVRILSGSDEPVLRLASDIALTHHEHFDGSGYPHGLKGVQIPLSARIVAVADVFDAVAMDRSYRPAMSFEHSVDLIQAERGSHFDPDVVDGFISVLDQVLELRNRINQGERPSIIPGVTDAPHGDPLEFYDSPLTSTPESLSDHPDSYEYR